MIDLAHSVGRYGAYIWPAYGVSLVGLVWMTVDTILRARRWRREVDRRLEDLSSAEKKEP
jgi:heme exporter protein CcmD